MTSKLYSEVTDQIIAELERGAAPWLKQWSSPAGFTGLPHNAVSRRAYSGVNVLLLWLNCAVRNYDVPAFVTFKQAKAAGGHVRKGEKGFRIVYASTFDKKRDDGQGGEEVERIPFLKAYTVFNVDQCDGLPPAWNVKPEPRPAVLIDDQFNRFIAATRATIEHKGGQPMYIPSADRIVMPHALDFDSYQAYQATLLHELVHWTGAKPRLDRGDGMAARFKTQAYAAEELVAEIGAAYLCAHLGVKGELRHAGYVESWLKLLRSDSRAIFTAASKATKAADYLRAFSEPAEAVDQVDQLEAA